MGFEKLFKTLCCASAACAMSVPAAGAMLDVVPISNNSGASLVVASQIQIDVSDVGAAFVDITVYNNGDNSTNFTIADFYIDDDAMYFDGFNALPNKWDTPAAPGNLPGGNNINFFATASSDADPPPTKNGINIGESVTFRMNLKNNVDYQDILDALNADDIRVGLHVQSIEPSGDSDGFVTTIPEPGSLALLVFGAALIARRRRS